MPQEISNSENENILTPVYKDLDDLFKILIKMHDQITPLFLDKKAQLNAAELQELEDLFYTVSDQDGVLGLQLKDSQEMHARFKFLKESSYINISKSAREYIPGISLGAGAGLVTAYGLGMDVMVKANAVAGAAEVVLVEAGAIACTSEVALEAALVGARVLNPVFFIPSVLFSSAAWFSIYMSRELSASIQRALKLYDDAKDAKDTGLIEAEEILNVELGNGAAGRTKITRTVRYPSTSSDQFDLLSLLLAQIHLKQEVGGSYDEFQRIIDSTASKNIKGMALVGQLDMLSPTSKWIFYKEGTSGLNKEVKSVEERMKLLDSKVKELNESHKELVSFYFNLVWNAYNSVLDSVKAGVCLHTAEEFMKQKLSINKILSFQGLHVLRYMGENGKLAEILFSFIQAVSHVMHDVHNKHISNNYNLGSESVMRNESELAKKQLSLCINLIDNYALNDDKFYSLANTIFVMIKKYKMDYHRHCDAKSNCSPEKKSVPNGLIFSKPVLTPVQSETLANNSLRSDPNPSESVRKAKLAFAKNTS